MIDRALKKNLRDVYEYKNFQALLDFVEVMIKRWDQSNVIGDTEFETIKLTMIREFKKNGLKEFFEEIEKEISND